MKTILIQFIKTKQFQLSLHNGNFETETAYWTTQLLQVFVEVVLDSKLSVDRLIFNMFYRHARKFSKYTKEYRALSSQDKIDDILKNPGLIVKYGISFILDLPETQTAVYIITKRILNGVYE
eukprot:Pgem_evm1s11565